jgi:hypothetical protein
MQNCKASQQLQKAFPKNVKTLNFYKLDEDFRSGAFYDAVHLTEEGNALLAERFYRAITSLPKLQLTPQSHRDKAKIKDEGGMGKDGVFQVGTYFAYFTLPSLTSPTDLITFLEDLAHL